MKNFRQLIKELPSKKVVMAFGRFQPPTTGHELLVNAVKKIAQTQGADHVIFASRSQDKKANPLPVDRKVYYLKRMFPKTNFVAANEQIRTFMEAAKELNKKYKHLVMLAGSDRVQEYKKLLEKYNGTEFKFDTIEVVSAGERDPDADSASGMSGTKMREAAKKGDYQQFKKGLPHTLTDLDGKRLMNEIRQGMGLEVIKEQIKFEVTDIRERYHAGDIFKLEEIVESNGIVYQIKKRGSNHLLLQDEAGNLVSKWLQDVQQTTQEFKLQEGLLNEMKFSSADKIKVARIIASAFGIEDVEKSSNAEQLVNAALRKIRSKNIRPEYAETISKMLATAKEAGINFDEKLVPQKAQEVKEEQITELEKETLKSYIAKSMGSKSAADFTRGVKMAQGSGGEEELRKKSEKRSAGIHTAIKKLTKEELGLDEAVNVSHERYVRSHSKTASGKGLWAFTHKRMGDVDHTRDDEVHKATGSFSDAKKSAKMWAKKHGHSTVYVMEEVELDEGKMGQLSADIGSHIDKHVDDYKAHGGAEHLMSKIDHTAKKISAQHGLEHKHAHKFVSDYVEKKLHEEKLDEISDHTLSTAIHKRYQQAVAAKHGSPEHAKALKSMGHMNDVALKRTQNKLMHMAKHDPEAYKKSAAAAADADHKRGWSTEETEIISDLLEQIATAKLTGKSTDELQKKLVAARTTPFDVKNNDSDVGSDVEKPDGSEIGASMTHDGESPAVRKMKIKYVHEENDDSQKLAKQTEKANLAAKQAKEKQSLADKQKQERDRLSECPCGTEDDEEELNTQDIGNALSPTVDLKLPKDALPGYVKEEEECESEKEDEQEENELDDLTDKDLDAMADEIDTEDDVLDVYDDEELAVVDDETGEFLDDIKEETINEVLSRSERMKAKTRFAKTAAKRERKAKIALKSRSSATTINKRARRLAIQLMKKRIAKKPLNKLSIAEKERAEKMIHKRKALVDRLAMKLAPRIRKIENDRLTHKTYTK